MEEKIEQYINRLIQDCLNSPKLNLTSPDQKEEMGAKIRNYFNAVVFDTLIENLTNEQLLQIKDLDLKSPEAEIKMAELAASVPGFILLIDEQLKQKSRQIFETGQIPVQNE